MPNKEFEEGEAAYEPGKTPSCPHEDGTQECSDWWKGFRAKRLVVKSEEKSNE